MADFLQVGGFVPFTTIDFPTVNSACVVFCQGCPWRCPYCQNEPLQPNRPTDGSWPLILKKIEERRHFIEGVVFSGGEPLMQAALPDVLQAVHHLGLKTALHTGGAWPQRLAEALPYLDWVGFDVKTSFDQYDALTCCQGSGKAASESLRRLADSSVPFECRTTLDPAFVGPDQVRSIVQELQSLGVQTYALQECYDAERHPLQTPCLAPDFLEEIRGQMPQLIVRSSSI